MESSGILPCWEIVVHERVDFACLKGELEHSSDPGKVRVHRQVDLGDLTVKGPCNQLRGLNVKHILRPILWLPVQGVELRTF